MSTSEHRENVRNVAIIAHVDHGKTTLVDAFLKQTGAYDFKEGEVAIMDSNPLERERGITIYSKNASFQYKDIQFNIVDTPGHADFGSEVERILSMVDGALILVDAFEGPMPQTKFVLRKALELGLKPILIINKIDKPNCRPEEVVNMTFDLFCELNATDEQLDFAICYASGKDGTAKLQMDDEAKDMMPILDTIIDRVPPPVADPNLPFQMLVTMLDYNSYLGEMGIGRILHGKVKVGDQISLVQSSGKVQRAKVTKIFKYRGLQQYEADEAMAGDIVSIAGVAGVQVGETLTSPDKTEALPTVKVDEPTISMSFSHNTSPLSGKDGGKFLTSRQIRERLWHEAKINVGIQVEEEPGGERFKVSGRGELHLAILIEQMRRESYELEVGRPKVIIREVDGKKMEPIEELVVEVEPDFQGAVIEALGTRKGEMKDMQTSAVGTVRMEFLIPSRSLLGFRNEFLVMTRGSGIMYQNFYEYQPYKGEIPGRPSGVLISQSGGQAVGYALNSLQERGELFVSPQAELYEGMVVGVNNKGHELVVTAIKEKKLTNTRAAGSDDSITLTPPREMTLEFALEFIADDELVEVTPENIRMRKMQLSEHERRVKARQK